MDLEKILGNMPRKTFLSNELNVIKEKINIPENETVLSLLKKIMRLPSVCSKRFLTTKVDRHVTGNYIIATTNFINILILQIY